MSRGDSTSLPPFGVIRRKNGSLEAVENVKDLKRKLVIKNLAIAYTPDVDAKLKRKELQAKLPNVNLDDFMLDADGFALLKSEQTTTTGKPYVYFLTTTAKAELIDLKEEHDLTLDPDFF